MANGEFEFLGSVLLPVTQAGLVLFDRGVEVRGFGRTNQDKTSLTIEEFVRRGERYRLKAESSAMVPGTGGVVQFRAGQVFEMWLGSASTYERVPRKSGQPKP